MDSINFTINETVLTGAEGLLSSVDDRTIASTPAPIAVSTVGRDRGTRRIFTKEIRGSLFSISPPCHDPSSQNNAEDSLGLLPPGCLMGMSNSLLPLETINNDNNSRQGSASIESFSSKEISSDSHETLATIKKCPPEPVTRSNGIFKPQVLFPQFEEENVSKIDSPKENSTKDLFCFEAEAHQSIDSGVGQTNSLGSHIGQTLSRRSMDTNKTDNTVESSVLLDGIKTKIDSQNRQTFFESLFQSNDGLTKTATAGKAEAYCAESKLEQDSEIFQNVKSVSKDIEDKFMSDDHKEFPESYFDNFDYKVSIKADLQQLFSNLNLGSTYQDKESLKMDSSKRSDPETPTEQDQGKVPLHLKTSNAPVMDGPFKKPFLSKVVASLKKDNKASVNDINTTKSDQVQSDSSLTEWGPSINFGDSLVQQIESTSEWGPSIQFGESVHLPDTPKPQKENSLSGDKEVDKSNIGKQEICNPFDGFDQDMLNASEEFIEDPDAKAHLLEDDMQQFVKENPFSNLTVDITRSSYRGVEDTFMDQTIGTYLAAGSKGFDSLSSAKYNRERPDIGMPVSSPPAIRRVIPILQPSEIYSPVNIRNIRSKPLISSVLKAQVDEVTFEVSHDQTSFPSLKDASLDQGNLVNILPPADRNTTIGEVPNLIKEKEVHSDSGGHSSSAVVVPISEEKVPKPLVALQQMPHLQKKQDVAKSFHNFTLHDGSVNLTSDMTYSALHKLIEGLDSDTTHPENLILPEVDRHFKEKKAFKSQGQGKEEVVGNPEKNPSESSKEVQEKKADVVKIDDNSVFKVPFPVKNLGSVGIKASKASSVTMKTFDNSAREVDLSTNLQHYDDLSASITMSLAECSLTPYTTKHEECSTKMNTNNNNSKSDFGHPQVTLSSYSVSEIGRNIPQKLIAVTNPPNIVQNSMLLAPLPENSAYDNSTMDFQTMSSSTYFRQIKQGSLRAMAGVSKYEHQMLSDITDLSCDDISMDQQHTLCPDNSQSVLLHVERGFAYSTPMPGSKPLTSNELQEKSILPMITPMTLENILKLPKTISFPEATCILLSQEMKFTITNLLDKGVKCTVTIREVICRGQRMNHYCPFHLKSQIILSGHSFQDVQVIFQPKEEGEHTTTVEFVASNMLRPQETRVYYITISAFAEKPSIKIWPEENVLNFGSLPWGETTCRSINIQNNGQATVPLILNISKKEASLCNFTFFTKEETSNKSSISFTSPPDAKGSVLAISLPGVKDGKDPCIHTVELCCRAKGGLNILQKYQERCEHFQALLDIGVDMPVNGPRLKELKLMVTVGMYKLHVDKESLVIAALSGNSEVGSLHIVNSGNIPMPVELELSPSFSPFSISSSQIIIPPNDKIPIDISFTTQHQPEKLEKYYASLNLMTPLSSYSVKITGKVRGKEVKITSPLKEIYFGGVDLGDTQKQLYKFISHGDTKVRLNISNQDRSAFKLLNERGHEIDFLEMPVEYGRQYEIWISFCPTEVKGYSSDLVLKAEHSSKYSVPIRGYGGRSHVEIKDLINDKNELFLNVGKIISGEPVGYKMKIKNTGTRCCFIKTLLKDINGIEFQPFQASIVPSLLLLTPHESADVMVVIFPSPRDLSLSSFNHLATIRLIFGDEINRQHFLMKPGKREKHLIEKFDVRLPLNNTLKKLINNEMQTLPCYEDTFSVLKNSLFKMHIKLIVQAADSRSAMSSQHKVETENFNRQPPSLRPVLSPLNPNVTQPNRGKDEWTVAPKDIWINNGDETTTIKQSVQVINFSMQELKFYVECGENLIVSPTKGIVKSKDTIMLHVSVINKNIAANWFGLIHVFVSPHDRQVVKVFLTSPSDVQARLHVTPSSITDPRKVSQSAQRSPGKNLGVIAKPHSLNQQLPFFPPALSSNEKIQGSDKAIIMTTEAGTKSYLAYNFTNTSHKPLSWKLVPFVPPYVKGADETHDLYRVDYEVFKLVPTAGTLQPDETEKITIEFSPRSKGFFNQDWSIHETKTQAVLHSFTVLAKSIINPCKDNQPVTADSVPEGLSKTSLPPEPKGSSFTASPAFKSSFTVAREQNPNSRRSIVTDIPAVPKSEKTETFSPVAPFKALPQSSNFSDLDMDRAIQQKDKLSILEPNVNFLSVPIGGFTSLKIQISNTTDQKVEIVVNYEPKPPFMIKHYSFEIDKDKMKLFPVIFKPRHAGHFKDKVIFTDKASGTNLTAFLEARCLQ